jgi:excinuclease ABC subunit C
VNRLPAIEQTLASLPHGPGVYLMKGKSGEVIYIGKAKVLASRVRSYFHARADLSPKIGAMVAQIVDIDYLVVASDLDALVLEGNLIKQHRPRYNVVLRDDKNYPFLRLPLHEDYPRPEIVRGIKKDGARYFGPYIPSGGLHELLRLLRKIFPIPNCTILIDGKADRPCIEFEIGRCLAPCTGNQSQASYRKMIEQVVSFLEGRDRTLLPLLKNEMQAQAEALAFEEAAKTRDRIGKIERALGRQRITSTRMDDLDVIGIAHGGECVAVQLLFIRGGMLIGRKSFFFGETERDAHAEFITTFLRQFYQQETIIPPVVLAPVTPAEPAIVEAWLSERRGRRVRLVTPLRGRGAHLVALADENAQAALARRIGSQQDEETLRALQSLLHLRRLPHRIEGYDISNLMGNDAVGSMVVFEGGKAKPSDFRHFRIKTIEGANDFGMMAEVLARRIGVLRTQGDTQGEGEERTHSPDLPDLILIDGGQGQLSAVCHVLQQHGLDEVDVIGLAKERSEQGLPERVYLPGNSEPIVLPAGAATTHLLTRIRDEAHRFAVTHHRKVRGRRMLHSLLDDVEGIGKKRRLALLKYFGTLANMRTATPEALASAPLMNKSAALRLHQALLLEGAHVAPSLGEAR